MLFNCVDAQVPAEERKKQAREKMLYVDQILQPNPYTKAEKTAPPPRKKQIRKRKRAEMTETPKDPNANSKDSVLSLLYRLFASGSHCMHPFYTKF